MLNDCLHSRLSSSRKAFPRVSAPLARRLRAGNGQLRTVPRRGSPLLPIRGAGAILDRNEDQILRLIEEGQILYAWNVGLSAREKELRLLMTCVQLVADGQPCDLEWPNAINLVVPHDNPELCMPEVTHVLNVSSLHVFNLIKRGELSARPGWRPGRNGAARISRASFIAFLGRRCWPVPFTGD